MQPSIYQKSASDGRARTGQLLLKGGQLQIPTPAFMPVGTAASVKGLWQFQIEEMGYRLILGNTYHLYLRPGCEVLKQAGGLARFQSWPHAILTDSGGYQVFSLAERVRFFQEGVEFQSHIDGSRHLFTPQRVIDFQLSFGSDIMMLLDDCPPANANAHRIRESLERTHLWAKQAFAHYRRLAAKGNLDATRQHLFGIAQGALDFESRRESLDIIQSLPFAGIAVGGLSVGESRNELYEMLDFLGERLDAGRPRYLMGVGTIPDILEAVKNGFDMFDCVLPTRNARNGQLLTSEGKLNIRNKKYRQDPNPPDAACGCRVCQNYSRAYLRHLFLSREMAGPMLASYHNLFFYFRFMGELRESVEKGAFGAFFQKWKKIAL